MATKDNLNLHERVIHSSNLSRRADMYNVSFLGIRENIANILGKQLRGIDRLNIQYDSTRTKTRGGYHHAHKDQPNFDPINVTFHEDEDGVVESFIMTQIFRQNSRIKDIDARNKPTEDMYKFDCKVDTYNTAGIVTGGVTYKNCFFTMVNMQTLSYDDDSDCIITAMIEFDDIDIFVVDRYIELDESQYT